jgi:hypothetical protein
MEKNEFEFSGPVDIRRFTRITGIETDAFTRAEKAMVMFGQAARMPRLPLRGRTVPETSAAAEARRTDWLHSPAAFLGRLNDRQERRARAKAQRLKAEAAQDKVELLVDVPPGPLGPSSVYLAPAEEKHA